MDAKQEAQKKVQAVQQEISELEIVKKFLHSREARETQESRKKSPAPPAPDSSVAPAAPPEIPPPEVSPPEVSPPSEASVTPPELALKKRGRPKKPTF